MTKMRIALTVAPLALMLAACGGGSGGGGVDSIPTPPPAPMPIPSGSGTTTALTIFPHVTASTEFAVLGSEAVGSSSTLETAGLSVRYDAPTASYVMDFPSTEPAAYHAYNSPGDLANEWAWNGTVGEHEATVGRPTNPDLQLTYTTLATYGTYSQGSVPAFGWLAFGSATPAAGVPVTGTASYSALVQGSTIDRTGYIGGTATLDFNFGAGTLSGHFDPVLTAWDSIELGRYSFVNTVYGSGSTSFSGQLSHSQLTQNGTFNGQFTGPLAQKLMARWSASYIDPLTLQQSTMFGVWVGRH